VTLKTTLLIRNEAYLIKVYMTLDFFFNVTCDERAYIHT
jgi:hypothetical protein